MHLEILPPSGYHSALVEIFPGPVAVLDPRGRVLALNDAWTRQMATRPLLAWGVEGANLPAAWDAAALPLARDAAAGIRLVLAGAHPSFSLEHASTVDDAGWHLVVTAIDPARGRGAAAYVHLHPALLPIAGDQRGRDALIRRVAGRLARLGGWHVTVADMRLVWSDETALIHDHLPGYSPTVEEALACYPPEHRPAIVAAFTACVTDGTPYDLDLEILTARGRRVWIRTVGEAVRDSAGRITQVQGAFQDISEQRAAAEQIRALGERLHGTLEAISDAFFTLDEEWRFTYLNAAAERLLQRPRSTLVGRVLWEEFPAAIGTPFETQYRRAVAEQVRVSFQAHYAPLDRWREVDAHPVGNGLAVYFRDVTERRKADERLREQATLLDKANDAIVVRDLEGRIRYWNASAERVYGWSARVANGRLVTDLLCPDLDGFERATGATLARGEWEGELALRTRAGQQRTIACRWTLVRDDAGEPRSILAIEVDVTDRRRVEAQALQAQRMESIGALAGGIAHDLNNTLSPILWTVTLLEKDEEDPARREDLATIAASASRAAEMVRQLLSFARGTAERRAPTDLARVVAEVQKMVRDVLPKNITLRTHVAPDLWTIDADATQMHQLLTNLCVNARDAMPLGGTLDVTVSPVDVTPAMATAHPDARPGPHLCLTVEDTGTGMTPDVLARSFEPFFTTKPLGEGTGLGLSTVHAIVRSHGGFVQVHTEVGRGTRFDVYVPADPTGAAPSLPAPEAPGLPHGSGELVLVVDDEEIIRSMTRRTLERYGYRVLLASHGGEAVDEYTRHAGEIAAVVTDMTMPVMDGPATILALKAIDPTVRIIGSSGLYANDQVERARAAGVEHFVPKPYTAETMLRVLRELLDGR